MVNGRGKREAETPTWWEESMGMAKVWRREP